MLTSERGIDACKFYPEPVRPIRPGAGFRDVQSPRSKVHLSEEVRAGRATDIAVPRSREGIHVRSNIVAADVQTGESPGRVMVHEVHMAEEPAVLASCHEAEVRVVAAVGEGLLRDYESSSGREVARLRNLVGVSRNRLEHQQCCCHESSDD